MSRKHEKTCVHTSVSDKNQSSSQTKGFMHRLVQKILGTCERVANQFLHPGANYTYMYNLHTVCKSAHVNGALEFQCDIKLKRHVHDWVIVCLQKYIFNVNLFKCLVGDQPKVGKTISKR